MGTTDADPLVIVGVQFNEVGTENGAKFKDIKGDFEDFDTLQFSFTDEDGLPAFKDFYYLTVDGTGVTEDGWYDGEDWDNPVSDQNLELGRAAWFSPNSAKSLNISGEVKKGHKIHTFTDPMTFACSYYPVPFCPNAATVSFPYAEEFDTIQRAYTDADGLPAFKDFYYLTTDGTGVPADGWYDGEDWDAPLSPTTPVANAGEGFWYSPNTFETASFTEISPLGDTAE